MVSSLWVHVVGTPRGHILEQFRPFNSAFAVASCWQSGRTCQASSTASFTFPWPTETCLVVVSLRSGSIALQTGRHRPVSSSVPCPALLDVSLRSCCSYRRDGCHAGGWHAVHEGTRLATICFSASSCTSSLFTRMSHAQHVCDDHDSVNVFRKFALFKGSLYTHT